MAESKPIKEIYWDELRTGRREKIRWAWNEALACNVFGLAEDVEQAKTRAERLFPEYDCVLVGR